ncbi:MAG: hypothetical protein IPG63_00520 [Xanthomonadales bacterium]|nr:hypothetical protein [Xanthomonadales bacterium]
MTGVSGPVGLANSLVGTAPADRVGYRLTKLVSGGAVAQTQSWNNGAAVDAGAATWINPGAPTIGEVSALNSLVGSTTNDRVSNSGVTALANGNYVVASMNWNAPGASSAGAATWGDGMSGTTGVVSASNSLIGSTAYDNVGYNVVPLSNGHYVASSSFWDHAGLVDAGAVTWCDGFVGAAGPVNMSNSLVGGAMHDGVGSVQALPNGNYVVDSGGWANGASADAGAVTWGNGLGGTSGLVSSANSFVGANSESIAGRVRLLSGGAYAIVSYNWDDGARQDVGAVRWSDGLAAITGTHSSTVSLLGASTGDFFGAIDDVGAGHFLLRSDRWSNGPAAFSGAIFSGNGAATGLITSENAWVGDSEGDSVGWDDPVIYPDGLFVLKARTFDHNGLQNVGAVTVGNRSVQPRGIVSEENSCIGTIEYGGVGNIARFPNEQRVAVQSKGNRVVIFDLPMHADGFE